MKLNNFRRRIFGSSFFGVRNEVLGKVILILFKFIIVGFWIKLVEAFKFREKRNLFLVFCGFGILSIRVVFFYGKAMF